MKNKMLVVIAGLMTALVLIGVIGATGAFAQGPTTTPTAPSTESTPPIFPGRGHGEGHFLGMPELEAAAQALNMTTDELTAALQSGKTLEQIASDAGVDIATVQEAIHAAHVEEMRTRIQQAVDDGTITQENADWLFEGLDKGFIGVPGAFGFGGPHGGGHGFGKGSDQNNQLLPPQQPAQPNQQNTPQG